MYIVLLLCVCRVVTFVCVYVGGCAFVLHSVTLSWHRSRVYAIFDFVALCPLNSAGNATLLKMGSHCDVRIIQYWTIA